MTYHFQVHQEGQGFWAGCIEIRGIVTQANTHAELSANAKEALDLALDEPEDSKMIFPLPQELKGRNIIAIEVDPSIAFAMLVRQARIAHKLTQQQAAKAMGFKGLYSYQRLESGKHCNPALSTIVKVCKVFPEVDLSLVC